MGEEWRRGWHPERVPAGDGGSVLIVGAGPAGLEAAHILGKRGYSVTLADAATQAGGRISLESALPGLAEWARVRDYRLGQINRMPNVTMYLGSPLAAPDVREFAADHVIVATGARWRADGVGRHHRSPIAALHRASVMTPDDLMRGARPAGHVTVFDDDHYYMGPVLATLLARDGATVTYVTTEGKAAHWSQYTGEQERTQQQLIELGVTIIVNCAVTAFDGRSVALACVYSGRVREHAAGTLVLVTSREPQDSLYRELAGPDPDSASGSVQRIGDCQQPALIAHAVYAGHKAARELGAPAQAHEPLRDRVLATGAGSGRSQLSAQ
jgi:dimethylamine/trimethylamine dehydrogenase